MFELNGGLEFQTVEINVEHFKPMSLWLIIEHDSLI
jgi:hypothetical protein